MSAIITQDFKKQIAQLVFNDVLDSAQIYYIGIGKSEQWDSSELVPTPIESIREIRNARLSLQSIKSAEDISFVVPRNNWSSGTIYSAYDDNVAGYPTKPYYVMTDANSVYICLQQGIDASGNSVTSTVKPTGNSTKAFTTSDGYVWKFLYSITALDASKFLTSNFIPVKLIGVTDSATSAIEVEQKGIQTAAVPGQISGATIVSTGAGYTSAPAISIIGDGSGAAATATVVDGIVKVEMDNDSSALGSGYTYAEAVLSGGGFTTAASIRPKISPVLGFGGDPRDDLKSSAILFNTKPSGAEGGDFIITNDFRQVVLMKGIKKANDSNYTAATSNMLNTLHFNTVSVDFSPDKTILGGTSAAKAYVDKYDTTNKLVYFHQNEITGFKSFSEGETITETNGTGNGILDSAGFDINTLADSAAPANPFSGTVLYVDNRSPVVRSSVQTEDIKAVIQF